MSTSSSERGESFPNLAYFKENRLSLYTFTYHVTVRQQSVVLGRCFHRGNLVVCLAFPSLFSFFLKSRDCVGNKVHHDHGLHIMVRTWQLSLQLAGATRFQRDNRSNTVDTLIAKLGTLIAVDWTMTVASPRLVESKNHGNLDIQSANLALVTAELTATGRKMQPEEYFDVMWWF